MAGTLSFPINPEFRRMVDQAVKRKSKIVLVKDQGVYLMAFGAKPEDNKICYANGLDPNKDDFDSWYDRAHRICGGDDFAEHLETEFFQRVAAGNSRTLKVKLTATSLKMEAV